eukprot:756959-Hanusia_phi.AAC.2
MSARESQGTSRLRTTRAEGAGRGRGGSAWVVAYDSARGISKLDLQPGKGTLDSGPPHRDSSRGQKEPFI